MLIGRDQGVLDPDPDHPVALGLLAGRDHQDRRQDDGQGTLSHQGWVKTKTKSRIFGFLLLFQNLGFGC